VADALKLDVKNLSVTYLSQAGDPVHAVNDISFEIANKPGCGEIIVFVGPSGCGKSTILKSIAGLIAPTKGSIVVDGKAIAGTSRERGMVFQGYTSFAWLTVRENVEYGMRLAGVPAAERKKRALETIEKVGLKDFASRYPKELSGGMKQRVAIARTLVNNPALVLMDEPFGALDPQTRWDMQSLLLDISKSLDNTIIFVTHDIAEAVYLADTVFVMSARPARILKRMDIPAFPTRDISLRQAPQFRDLEATLLDLLHDQKGHVRVS
jgi:NitT/TauT family transport system ATP-binding protein